MNIMFISGYISQVQPVKTKKGETLFNLNIEVGVTERSPQGEYKNTSITHSVLSFKNAYVEGLSRGDFVECMIAPMPTTFVTGSGERYRTITLYLKNIKVLRRHKTRAKVDNMDIIQKQLESINNVEDMLSNVDPRKSSINDLSFDDDYDERVN